MTECSYTEVARDSYGTDWETQCGQRIPSEDKEIEVEE